jgi:hypothetical protein
VYICHNHINLLNDNLLNDNLLNDNVRLCNACNETVRPLQHAVTCDIIPFTYNSYESRIILIITKNL